MKRMLAMVLSVLLCLLLLTACNGAGGDVSGVSDDPTSIAGSEQENNSTHVDADAWFNEHYVDAYKLPILDVHIESPFVSGDRTLVFDDTVENNLEMLVYEYYRDETAGAFADQQSKVAGEVMEINVNNTEKQFKEGIYLSNITLEEVDLVDKDEINEVREHHKQRIVKTLTELGMTEFAFVEVEETIRHNDKSIGTQPQFGDGEYTKYYLLGKQNGGYKIVEVDMAGTGGSWFPED